MVYTKISFLKKSFFFLIFCLFLCLNMGLAEAKYTISNNLLRIGKGIEIESNAEVLGYVICIGGPIKVYGEVKKSVISVGQAVMVYGKVGGRVVALGGGVRVDRKAEIKGDVLTVGGVVKVDPRAKIQGDVVERKYKTYRFRTPLYFFKETYLAFSDLSKVIVLIGLISLAVIIKLLFKERLKLASTVYKKNALLLTLVGVLSFIMFLFLSAFLIVSIVFIPFIPLLMLAMLVFVLIGLITFSIFIGERFKGEFKYLSKIPFLNLIIIVIFWACLVYFPYNLTCILFFILSSYFLGAFVYFLLFLPKRLKRNR